LRHDGEHFWQPVGVPGCWEQAGHPKTDPGPYWYRTSFHVPEGYAERRIWLSFGAVSYACRVYVNGHEVGEHTGMWDAFTLEITDWIQPGENAELLVRVEKPASLTAGPDSQPVPGNYPLRGTLSGFLPYVWGHAFGGIWQEVGLYATGKRILTEAWIQGNPDGQVFASITTSSPGPVQVTICDPGGKVIYNQSDHIDQTARIEIQVPNPMPWSLTTPNLYSAKISLPDNDERLIRFGLRLFEAQGRILALNDQPVFPRLILSWGWYPNFLYPSPGENTVRDDIQHLRTLGYNGIKLCLWFPPSYYFDLADELGMLLWVELPMWLPLPNEGFRNQTIQEYDKLVRQARQHPSVVLYTLGCELSQAVDGELLGQLYAQTKELTSGALVCDNSGGSEAYYGTLLDHADFYDNHLYCELQYLRPTLDAFAPGWRVEKPWLMGEFCDFDTFPNPVNAWWANPDPIVNPQGARWEMRVATHADQMEQNGLSERVKELTTASYRQADLSGYVITGEVDTPVSTAGMQDAYGKSKFETVEFTPFNQDFMLVLGRDRRREWVAGGDRSSPRDCFNHTSGSIGRFHLVGSNYSPQKGVACVSWEIAYPGDPPFLHKEESPQFEVTPGRVQELTVMEFEAPEVTTPRQAMLQAQVCLDGLCTKNAWPLWFYPPDAWSDVPRFGLFDPINSLQDLPKLTGEKCISGFEGVSVVVCSSWTETADAFVKRGGKVILLQGLNESTGPLPAVPVPYWREALKLIQEHPAWGDFPHGNAPDMQFYTLAPDCALDTSGFQGRVNPIFRRLDMRGMELLEYAVEIAWGRGRIIATTLRFSGGIGDQPIGLRYCPAGQNLLANWVRSLHL
jgi:hypothetical protein